MNEKDIHLRSDEVNEIFAKIPSHMVLWGNTWILIILMALGFLAYYVKYPDILTGSITLSSTQAPVSLVAQQNGKLKLLKSNFEQVQKDQTIAYLENEMPISSLDSLYDLLKHHEVELLPNSVPNFNIGEFQNDWSRFLIELEDWRIYNKIHVAARGIVNSEKQLKNNTFSSKNIEDQIGFKSEQMNVALEKLKKDKQMFQKGMITERDYQNSYNNTLEIGNSIKSLQSQLIQIQKSNLDYKKQIEDFSSSNIQTQSQKLTTVKQSRCTLLEKIEAWYIHNSFRSPIDGVLQYNAILTNDLFVSQGTELFTISPANPSTVKGYVLLPMTGMGKASLGQKVIVRLQNFPEEEFGVLKGVIEHIAPSPNKEKMYLCIVNFPNGLLTSYKKTIPYQPKMEGTADIVTKDKSLLHRIFEQLIKLIKRN